MSDDLQYELAKMKVGERIAADGVGFMKVPNGWVIEYWYEDTVTACTFVPDLQGGVTTKKKSPILVR